MLLFGDPVQGSPVTILNQLVSVATAEPRGEKKKKHFFAHFGRWKTLREMPVRNFQAGRERGLTLFGHVLDRFPDPFSCLSNHFSYRFQTIFLGGSFVLPTCSPNKWGAVIEIQVPQIHAKFWSYRHTLHTITHYMTLTIFEGGGCCNCNCTFCSLMMLAVIMSVASVVVH